MSPKRLGTQATKMNPKREAGLGSCSSSVDVDLPLGTLCGSGTPLKRLADSSVLCELVPHHCRATPKAGHKNNGEDDSSTPSSSIFQATDTTSTALDPGPVMSVLSGPPNYLRIPAPTAPRPRAIAQPATTLQGLGPQANPSIARASETNMKPSIEERTHFVWMFAGDGPSITRTSPTPPLPTRHAVTRRRPNLARARDALALPGRQRSSSHRRPIDRGAESERAVRADLDSEEKDDNDRISSELTAEQYEVSSGFAKHSGSPVVAGDCARSELVFERPPAARPSHRRTLAEYDRTNARIRALNAELLPNPGFQRHSHPYRTPARRAQRSNVRYLNVPGAVADALMAVRALRESESKRRASSAGTGIVDISESESSEFESGDEEEEGERSGRTVMPGGTTSEAPKAEACSETTVCAKIPRGQRPEQAARTAAAPAEPEDCVSVAGSRSAINDLTPPTDADAHGSQWWRLRSGPFARDHARTAEEDRLQPGRHPARLQNSTPASTSTSTPPPPAPHRQGKKRARVRDSDMDGDRVRVEASESLAWEGKRRKASPGANVSAT